MLSEAHRSALWRAPSQQFRNENCLAKVWVVPPAQDSSHHQDDITPLGWGSLHKTFICHYYLKGDNPSYSVSTFWEGLKESSKKQTLPKSKPIKTQAHLDSIHD